MPGVLSEELNFIYPYLGALCLNSEKCDVHSVCNIGPSKGSGLLTMRFPLKSDAASLQKNNGIRIVKCTNTCLSYSLHQQPVTSRSEL